MIRGRRDEVIFGLSVHERTVHHRDIENTEIAQRVDLTLCPLCVLCVSVVKSYFMALN